MDPCENSVIQITILGYRDGNTPWESIMNHRCSELNKRHRILIIDVGI